MRLSAAGSGCARFAGFRLDDIKVVILVPVLVLQEQDEMPVGTPGVPDWRAAAHICQGPRRGNRVGRSDPDVHHRANWGQSGEKAPVRRKLWVEG